MEEGQCALWQAFGQLRLEPFLPSARDPEWRRITASLATSLQDNGITTRIRSPRSLWSLLHTDTYTPGITWDLALRHQTWDRLCRAVATRVEGDGIRLAG